VAPYVSVPATNPPRAKLQLAGMRTLGLNGVLAAALLLLAGCGTYCPTDMHGLDPPPWGSSIPNPHS
jgi:hypothetical protein